MCEFVIWLILPAYSSCGDPANSKSYGWKPPQSDPSPFMRRRATAKAVIRHVLTAAHCFDENADGRIDALLGGFPFFFRLRDGERFRIYPRRHERHSFPARMARRRRGLGRDRAGLRRPGGTTAISTLQRRQRSRREGCLCRLRRLPSPQACPSRRR